MAEHVNTEFSLATSDVWLVAFRSKSTQHFYSGLLSSKPEGTPLVFVLFIVDKITKLRLLRSNIVFGL